MNNKQKLTVVSITFATLAAAGYFVRKHLKVKQAQLEAQLIEAIEEE